MQREDHQLLLATERRLLNVRLSARLSGRQGDSCCTPLLHRGGEGGRGGGGGQTARVNIDRGRWRVRLHRRFGWSLCIRTAPARRGTEGRAAGPTGGAFNEMR
eukprot:COSAG01_NODE_3306_length_6291_cov_15.294574_5_plen_103_part_00